MEEVRGVTIDTGEEKKEKTVRSYGAKLSVLGVHQMRIYSDKSTDEVLPTESIEHISLTDRELNYIKNYLGFLHVILKTKRTLPPTKNEAQGHDYPFCGTDKANYKPVQSLIKKGILKETMWRIGDKNNKQGSLRTFIALTPVGRKYIDEKILGPQQKEAADLGIGNITKDSESVSSDTV